MPRLKAQNRVPGHMRLLAMHHQEAAPAMAASAGAGRPEADAAAEGREPGVRGVRAEI